MLKSRERRATSFGGKEVQRSMIPDWRAATMASESFSEEKEQRRPTVQVGDPFTEKLLLEACLELFAQDYIVGIQDMGAAGLTSSSSEMAGRGVAMRTRLADVRARPAALLGVANFEFFSHAAIRTGHATDARDDARIDARHRAWETLGRTASRLLGLWFGAAGRTITRTTDHRDRDDGENEFKHRAHCEPIALDRR